MQPVLVAEQVLEKQLDGVRDRREIAERRQGVQPVDLIVVLADPKSSSRAETVHRVGLRHRCLPAVI